jgi:hypothetical protein
LICQKRGPTTQRPPAADPPSHRARCCPRRRRSRSCRRSARRASPRKRTSTPGTTPCSPTRSLRMTSLPPSGARSLQKNNLPPPTPLTFFWGPPPVVTRSRRRRAEEALARPSRAHATPSSSSSWQTKTGKTRGGARPLPCDLGGSPAGDGLFFPKNREKPSRKTKRFAKNNLYPPSPPHTTVIILILVYVAQRWITT